MACSLGKPKVVLNTPLQFTQVSVFPLVWYRKFRVLSCIEIISITQTVTWQDLFSVLNICNCRVPDGKQFWSTKLPRHKTFSSMLILTVIHKWIFTAFFWRTLSVFVAFAVIHTSFSNTKFLKHLLLKPEFLVILLFCFLFYNVYIFSALQINLFGH